jgi:hypothetical protein
LLHQALRHQRAAEPLAVCEAGHAARQRELRLRKLQRAEDRVLYRHDQNQFSPARAVASISARCSRSFRAHDVGAPGSAIMRTASPSPFDFARANASSISGIASRGRPISVNVLA